MNMMNGKIEQYAQPRHSPRLTMDFTPQNFEAFLLDTILTEILYCEIHPDPLHPAKNLLTALGKLQDQWYLVQLSSQDQSFEDIRIIQLPGKIIQTLKVKLEV
jgi:hypothetical protein